MSIKKKKLKHLSLIRESSQIYRKFLKFKRPKWLYIQRNYRKKFFKRSFFRRRRVPFFYSQHKIKTGLRWSRTRFFYKQFLLSKNRFYSFYNLRSSLKSLKKLLKESKSVYSFLINFEKRLDILLWRLGFFNSPLESRFFISHKKVLINFSVTNVYSKILEEGDLVQFDFSIHGILKKRLNKKKNFLIPYYVECNYNTMEFFLLSNLSKSSLISMNYLYTSFFDLSSLKNYFKLN